MSPSENDLRTALRDGEGDDRPDVDGLLAHVRGRRAQRRTRVLSTAAAVVVVAAAAVGGAAVWGGSDGHGQQGAGLSRSAAARTSPAGPGPVAPSVSFPVNRGRVACPAQYPGRNAPVAGTSATGRMFRAQVATVTVCSYTQVGSASGTTGSRAFYGSDATALAASIEQASASKLKIMCPDIASEQKTQLAIIAVTANGTQLPVVTTDVSIPNCNQPITNGTAVRYAWMPPAAIAARINALGVRTGASLPTPAGHSGLNGSPVR